MKICGGKTFAHGTPWLSCSEAMVTKDRGHEHLPRQRTPFRAMLRVSGCLELHPKWCPLRSMLRVSGCLELRPKWCPFRAMLRVSGCLALWEQGWGRAPSLVLPLCCLFVT